jgi:hypothetical protein
MERYLTLSTAESADSEHSQTPEDMLEAGSECGGCEDDNEALVAPRRGLLSCIYLRFNGSSLQRRLQSRPGRYIRRLLVYSVLLFVIFVFILWCGKLYEQAQVRKGTSTLRFYQTPKVCAMRLYMEKNASSVRSAEETIEIKTSDSVMDAHEWGHSAPTDGNETNSTRTVIAHCGDCGACSNPHDVRIYDETKNTLFTDTADCAIYGVVRGKEKVRECLAGKVDLTAPCAECWVENVMCDIHSCVFTCFFHALFNKGLTSRGETEELNDCTQCDETRCGAAFIACAGANRRRTGILSDIERDHTTEVCHKVDPKNWWDDESIHLAWEVQQNRSQG